MAERENDVRAIGLDIGTSRVVSARAAGKEYKYESQLNAFVRIPYSKLTEKALAKERVPHSVDGQEIVVHGSESERFADLLNSEILRPMTRGVLNAGEPDGLAVIREIARAVTGPAQAGERLCFTVPAAPAGAEDNVTYHEAALRQMLGELGYDVRSVNEGLAVIYAELEASNYTGIGISCGGGLCNVCLAYLAMPVAAFSLPKAGDFIDASAASAIGERANRVRILKEQGFYFNGQFSDKTYQALGVYYDEMIQNLIGGMKEAFKAHRLPKLTRPIPLVLSGGSAMPKGFRDRFEKALEGAEFPVAVSEVKLAGDPLTTAARGALVAALSEN